MKVKIGVHTAVECSRMEVDGPILKLWTAAAKGKPSTLILAYHLHPGDTVRFSEQDMAVDGEAVYEVTQ